MKQIVLILGLCFLVSSIYGQNSVSGIVSDENGEVLIGANVILENTYFGTSTDLNGAFSFSKVESGSYVLAISYMGFEKFLQNIEVQSAPIVVSVKMTRASVLAEEVIVMATRAAPSDPVTQSTIQKDEIEKRNLGQDMPYIFNLSPSTVVSSDAGAGVGYTSFRIRGSDLTRINVTINGIPLNDPESHGTWWVNLPDFASSVDNIQIQRGVGTSTNGAGAFGASVNLQTFKLREAPYAEVNSSYGSFNTFRNNIILGSGLLNDRFTFNARFSKINSDGYIDRAFSDLFSYSLSGGYYGKKDIVKLVFASGKEKTYQAWNGVPGSMIDTDRTYNSAGEYIDKDGNIKYYENETDNYLQNHLQIFYTREFLKELYLNLAFHYTKGKGFYEQYKENRKFSNYGMNDVVVGSDTIRRSDLIQQKWLDNDLYGITYSLTYKKSKWNIIFGGALNTYIGNHFGKVIWSQVAEKGEYNYEWYRNKGIKTDFNVYGKLNYQLLPSLNLFADMQIRRIWYEIDGIDDDLRDISQTHNYFFFNPKLGVNYQISEKHRTFFSFSVGNREPNRDNLVDADLTGQVPTFETLYDYELGYQFSNRKIKLELNMYYMDYNNQLALTGQINDVGAPVMMNVKDSYRAGVEIVAGFKITPKLVWELNATFSQNKIRDFTDYTDDWDTWTQRAEYLGTTDLSFSPNIIAGSFISYELIKNFGISFISKYVSKQYIDNTSNNGRLLNAYFYNDLILNYSLKTKIVKDISFKLLINNIFNAKYETNAWIYKYYENDNEQFFDGYFPQAGTNFLIGVQFKF
ncbi:MAG: TonB-dependent receptor [Bacteroidales bacterium]|nr:TonB-dependent receptor [Bacteroidales bacterium]